MTWNSYPETKPKELEDVLVYATDDIGDRFDIGCIINDVWTLNCEHETYGASVVSHWMELPDEPE